MALQHDLQFCLFSRNAAGLRMEPRMANRCLFPIHICDDGGGLILNLMRFASKYSTLLQPAIQRSAPSQGRSRATRWNHWKGNNISSSIGKVCMSHALPCFAAMFKDSGPCHARNWQWHSEPVLRRARQATIRLARHVAQKPDPAAGIGQDEINRNLGVSVSQEWARRSPSSEQPRALGSVRVGCHVGGSNSKTQPKKRRMWRTFKGQPGSPRL